MNRSWIDALKSKVNKFYEGFLLLVVCLVSFEFYNNVLDVSSMEYFVKEVEWNGGLCDTSLDVSGCRLFRRLK